MKKSANHRFAELVVIAYENNISSEVMSKVKWYLQQGIEVKWDGKQFVSFNHIVTEDDTK